MPDSSSTRRGRRPDPTLRDLWRQRLARFESSGLSAPAFCAQEGVPLPSFYAWRRRLNGPTAQRPTGPGPADARFVPVRVADPAPVEVRLASGATLRLAPGCDLDFVRSLVAALGGRPC
jgi:hypothetical protein